MTIYNCNGCDYTTNIKTHMLNHVDKATLCIEFPDGPRYTSEKRKKEKKIHSCKKCDKEFTTSSNRKRHEDNCSVEPSVSEPTIQNITNITNNNNITINIQLAPFNDPYIPRTLYYDIKKYLKSLIGKSMQEMTTLCYPGVFSMIYYNEDVPENHTILYKNKKENILHVFSGEKFIPIHKEEFRDALEKVLEYNINDCTNDLGNEAFHFYNRHHRHREDGKNEKGKEFDLYMERARNANKMVKKLTF